MHAPTRPDGARRPGRLATLVALGAALVAPGHGYRAAVGQPDPAAPAGLPACTIGDRLANATGYDEWASTLLDTEHRLPAGYVPPDLVEFGTGGRTVVVRAFIVADLRALLAAARRDGVRVGVTSGFRSHDEQAAVFERYAASKGHQRALAVVARPGHSEHQLGTTIDFSGDYGWLAANAWRFGFVLSYPPARSPRFTCYRPEPWHFRYYGRDRAASIHASRLSPREYLWLERERGASAGVLEAGGDATDGQVDEAQQLVALGVVVGQRAQPAEQQHLQLGE